MYDFLSKHGTLAAFLLAALLTIITLIAIGAGNVSTGLGATYFLFFVAAAAVIVLPILNAMGDPKSLMKTGIGVGAVLVLFLVCWGIAGDEVATKFVGKVTPGTTKFVGGGMLTMYVLFFLAIAGLIFAEISRFFK